MSNFMIKVFFSDIVMSEIQGLLKIQHCISFLTVLGFHQNDFFLLLYKFVVYDSFLVYDI